MELLRSHNCTVGISVAMRTTRSNSTLSMLETVMKNKAALRLVVGSEYSEQTSYTWDTLFLDSSLARKYQLGWDPKQLHLVQENSSLNFPRMSWTIFISQRAGSSSCQLFSPESCYIERKGVEFCACCCCCEYSFQKSLVFR